MIYSMTGYGKAEGEYQGRHYIIEIRTLNGRSTDVRMKIPNHFKSKEIQLRTNVLEHAHRGKIDVTIQTVSTDGQGDHGLNMNLVERYYDQLKTFADQKKMPPQDFLQTIIRIPSVIISEEEDITDDEWSYVIALLENALSELKSFRGDEGKSLAKDLSDRVQSIMKLQEEIAPYEELRKTHLQDRLSKQISDYQGNDKVDKNKKWVEKLILLVPKLNRVIYNGLSSK